jgi:hypothetical protein
MDKASRSVEERVRLMEDAEQIRALWHRYMLLFDRGGAASEIGCMFTEHAVFESRGADSPDRALQGRESIVADFLQVVTPDRPTPDERLYSGHQGTTYQVDVNGDDAQLRGRFFELTGRGKGNLLAIGGFHTLSLRREPSGWLISRLCIDITFCAQFDTVEPRTAFLGKPPGGSDLDR